MEGTVDFSPNFFFLLKIFIIIIFWQERERNPGSSILAGERECGWRQDGRRWSFMSGTENSCC